MTRFQDFPITVGSSICGVRFHPGALASLLPQSGCAELTDSAAEFCAIQPLHARAIHQRLDDGRIETAFYRAIGELFPSVPPPSPEQRALAFLRASKGLADLSSLAFQSGVSERHFRRLCLARTGLSPKALARILRFRHALTCIPKAPSLTQVAYECGYYDQAHFIHDFRQWTGRAPSDFYNPSSLPHPLQSEL